MATAWARLVHEKTGHKAVFGKQGKVHWSEVFKDNPHIVQPGEYAEAFMLPHYPGCRPYILAVSETHIVFNPSHSPLPGCLDIEPDPLHDGPYYVVEPHVKGKISASNKDWGWDKWKQLVDKLYPVFQPDYGKPLLEGVEGYKSDGFMDALRGLSGASYFIGTDGGLHHACAALGVPATVIWGGFSHPKVLGYEQHRNIGGGWCGAKQDCAHCREAMDRISVQRVLSTVPKNFN